METHQHQETSKVPEETETAPGKECSLAAKQQPSNSPVPSASSSPSHEFSFTISVHSSETTATSSPTFPAKTKHQAPLAIDLSPADDIFFHGHLLPLHFLSHLHASSPRSSTNSLESFNLPIREIIQEEKPNNSCNDDTTNGANMATCGEKQNHSKSKPFSLFGLAKWKKASETKEKSEKKKLRFDVSQFLKRYLKMVKPLLSPKAARENFRVRKQSYSFSGSLSPRNYGAIRGRRGEFSAPASMRTSPTNSGLLLATADMPSPVSESTMEELQAAIQAAIAHCKKSISAEENSHELSPVPVI